MRIRDMAMVLAVAGLMMGASDALAQTGAAAATLRGGNGGQANAASEHWVETWGAAETPARIPPANLAAGRGAQPAGTVQGQAGAASSAPATAAPAAAVPPAAPAAVQNVLTTPIPIAPQMAPPSNTAVGSSTPQRRYNLPRAVSNFDNQTVRMILHVSIGGPEIRVRFYNAVGARTVKIGTAHLALHAKESGIVPGSDRGITFGGKKTATMYAGQVLTSDPVRLTVPPLSDIAVSVYFPEDTGAPTNHPLGLQPTYTSGPGDFTSAAEISDPTNVSEAYYFLEGVDVAAPADAAAIVTFGDSITDGDQSTPGAYAMWPAILAERLHENAGTKNIAVVNEGISGNRILGDNVSGLSRFPLQALDVPGVKWITVLEGINDINGAMRANPPDTKFSAEDLISAYEQMIDAAHMRGIKVIGCTLTPYGGSSGYKDEGEAIREATNNWIRTSGKFDAVIDFDKAARDANDSKRFSPAAESPDLLHPGDAGYKMMAGAFRLEMFAGK